QAGREADAEQAAAYQQQQAAAQPAQAAPPAQSAAAPAASGDDSIAELERLAALKQQGVLTDAEFAAAKAKVLGL
ncbi:MAG: SHOCT domain-containing protein, partial [Catenulispora sp.]|nr:SHOCT domain-containing protein [Catenulispora sp.]